MVITPRQPQPHAMFFNHRSNLATSPLSIGQGYKVLDEKILTFLLEWELAF